MVVYVLPRIAKMPAVIEQYLAKLSPRDRIAVLVLTLFIVVSLCGLMALNLHRAAEKAQQQASLQFHYKFLRFCYNRFYLCIFL